MTSAAGHVSRETLVDDRQHRHRGICGRRVECWRDSCRSRFGELRTVEILVDQVIARCHRMTYAPSDPEIRTAGLS